MVNQAKRNEAVLRAELVHCVDREWALAALSAIERVQQLRIDHPGLEDLVAHHHNASHLGMTPAMLLRVCGRLLGSSQKTEFKVR